MTRRLGDLLVAEGLISEDQLGRALAEQKGTTEKLGSIEIREVWSIAMNSEDELDAETAVDLLTESGNRDPIAGTPYHKHVAVRLSLAPAHEAAASQTQSERIHARAAAG